MNKQREKFKDNELLKYNKKKIYRAEPLISNGRFSTEKKQLEFELISAEYQRSFSY